MVFNIIEVVSYGIIGYIFYFYGDEVQFIDVGSWQVIQVYEFWEGFILGFQWIGKNVVCFYKLLVCIVVKFDLYVQDYFLELNYIECCDGF